MGDIAGHQIYVIDDECLFFGVVIVTDVRRGDGYGKTGTMIVDKYRLSNFDLL